MAYAYRSLNYSLPLVHIRIRFNWFRVLVGRQKWSIDFRKRWGNFILCNGLSAY